MIRSLPAFKPAPLRAKRAAKRRGFWGLRALVAFLIALLQLASALHFTLVPHTFSAALGGVVHVHDGAAARFQPGAPARNTRAEMVSGAPTCSMELCPFADAPHGTLQVGMATLSGLARFGSSGMLTEGDAREASSRHVLSSAPKTSPPV
jgi:hypothetical protein